MSGIRSRQATISKAFMRAVILPKPTTSAKMTVASSK